MKKIINLIIALFIIINIYSQDKTECIYIDSIRINNKEEYIINNILSLVYEYDLYSKYCYNDSTVEYEYMIEYWDGMSFDTIYSKTLQMLPESYITQIPKTYTHKKPSFDGFIKYIMLKYNIIK